MRITSDHSGAQHVNMVFRSKPICQELPILLYTNGPNCHYLMDLSYQNVNAKTRSLNLQGLVHLRYYKNQITVVRMQGTQFATTC